jgi:thiol-disulfide isomerase/thioredoxin
MIPMELFTIFKIYYTYFYRILKNIALVFAFFNLKKARALGIFLVMGTKVLSRYEAILRIVKVCLTNDQQLITKKITVLQSDSLNNQLVSMFSLSVLKPRENSGAEGPIQFGKLTLKYLKAASKWPWLVIPGRLIIGLCIFGTVQAQNKFDIKPLEIGDTIPEALWEMSFPTVNHPNGKSFVKFKDYKDKKLIILDFWATWCGSCIANMPRTHKMESQIDGVKFIPITFEPNNKAAEFIKTNHITDSLKIYSIVEDKLLSKYFPHKYLPHYVWISTDGVVRAITGGREVTHSNLTQMLTSSLNTTLPRTKEMDNNSALLLSDDMIKKGLKYYSIFIKGIRPEYTTKHFSRSKNGVLNGMCYTNSPLIWMYANVTHELLLQKGVQFNGTTDIIIDVKEPENLDFNLTGIDKRDPDRQSLKYKWEEKNLYSYDIILPLAKTSQLHEYILGLINDSTPYHATIQKRMIGDKEKYMLIIKDDSK